MAEIIIFSQFPEENSQSDQTFLANIDSMVIFVITILKVSNINKPPRDKTNNVVVRPVKTQISLGIHPVWSVFAVRTKKACILSYPLSPHWRLWADWADAQTDLSLRWAHTNFVGFVTRRLK